ncbi:hypothetical protein PIROE2DRAFT_17316, partial [Piromyces sp. E2]
DYGVRLDGKVFSDKSSFYMIWNNECESIDLLLNAYTKICSSAPQLECAKVSPQNNGQISTSQTVVFCSRAPRNDLSLVYGKDKNEKDLRVGPTYAEWVKKCYVKECKQSIYEELAYKMGRRLKGK